MPDRLSEYMPNRLSEKSSGRMPGRLVAYMSGRVPERMLKCMSDYMSESQIFVIENARLFKFISDRMSAYFR